MADTNARIGYGIALAYSDDDSSYTTIAELLNLTVPGIKTSKVQIFRSDANTTPGGTPVPDQIPGWGDPQDAEFELVYYAGTANALYAIEGQVKYWKVTFPGALNVQKCKGFLSDFSPVTPIKDGAMSVKCKFTPSNVPAYTPLS